jgi:hypothetical protein
VENLTDVVDRELDALDPPVGVRCIYLHWFETRGLLALRTRSGLRELGPGGILVLRTRSVLQELGPDMGFMTQGGLWELGPGYLLISWPPPLAGFGSWDLEPTGGAPFGTRDCYGSSSSVTRTMPMNFVVAMI